MMSIANIVFAKSCQTKSFSEDLNLVSDYFNNSQSDTFRIIQIFNLQDVSNFWDNYYKFSVSPTSNIVVEFYNHKNRDLDKIEFSKLYALNESTEEFKKLFISLLRLNFFYDNRPIDFGKISYWFQPKFLSQININLQQLKLEIIGYKIIFGDEDFDSLQQFSVSKYLHEFEGSEKFILPYLELQSSTTSISFFKPTGKIKNNIAEDRKLLFKNIWKNSNLNYISSVFPNYSTLLISKYFNTEFDFFTSQFVFNTSHSFKFRNDKLIIELDSVRQTYQDKNLVFVDNFDEIYKNNDNYFFVDGYRLMSFIEQESNELIINFPYAKEYQSYQGVEWNDFDFYEKSTNFITEIKFSNGESRLVSTQELYHHLSFLLNSTDLHEDVETLINENKNQNIDWDFRHEFDLKRRDKIFRNSKLKFVLTDNNFAIFNVNEHEKGKISCCFFDKRLDYEIFNECIPLRILDVELSDFEFGASKFDKIVGSYVYESETTDFINSIISLPSPISNYSDTEFYYEEILRLVDDYISTYKDNPPTLTNEEDINYVYEVKDIFWRYNPQISIEELISYFITKDNTKENNKLCSDLLGFSFQSIPFKTKSYLQKYLWSKGLLVFDGFKIENNKQIPNFLYVYEYLNGNGYKKLKNLENFSDFIFKYFGLDNVVETAVKNQIQILQDNLPPVLQVNYKSNITLDSASDNYDEQRALFEKDELQNSLYISNKSTAWYKAEDGEFGYEYKDDPFNDFAEEIYSFLTKSKNTSNTGHYNSNPQKLTNEKTAPIYAFEEFIDSKDDLIFQSYSLTKEKFKYLFVKPQQENAYYTRLENAGLLPPALKPNGTAMTTDEYKLYLKELFKKDKTNANRLGELLISEFLKEGIEFEDALKIQKIWNERFNNKINPKIEKLPVFLRLSKYFKTNYSKEFSLKKHQIEGIKFCSSNNNAGILAHDVGGGKTTTAIASISHLFETGQANKLMLIVPNQVYNKWVAEAIGEYKDGLHIRGIIPHINLVGLGNGKWEYISKLKNITKNDKKLIKEYVQIKKNLISKLNSDSSFFDVSVSDLSLINEIENQIDSNLGNSWDVDFPSMSILISEIKSEFEEWKKLYDESLNTAVPQDLNVVEKYLQNSVIEIIKSFQERLTYEVGTWNSNVFADKTIYICTYGILDSLSVPNEFLESSIIYASDSYPEQLLKTRSGQLRSSERKYGGSKVSNTFYSSAWETKLKDLKDVSFNSFKIFNPDSLIVDEAHNFNTIYTKVQPRGVRNAYAEKYYRDNSYNYFSFEKYPRDITQLTQDSKIKPDTYYDFEIKNKGRSSIMGKRANYCLFALSLMVKNNSKKYANTIMLTATPFSDSPFELFSMMALTDINYLKENNIVSPYDFFANFLLEARKQDVNEENKLTFYPVVYKYRNTSVMGRIVKGLIDYKMKFVDVIRPEKIVLPPPNNFKSLNSEPIYDSYLPMNDAQKSIRQLISKVVSGEKKLEDICPRLMTSKSERARLIAKALEEESKKLSEEEGIGTAGDVYDLISEDLNVSQLEKNKVATIKGILLSKKSAISPYMFDCDIVWDDNGNAVSLPELTPQNFVDYSPKLKYVCGCIEGIVSYHKDIIEENPNHVLGGQIIYLSQGRNFAYGFPRQMPDGTFSNKHDSFELIKQYFIEKNIFSDEEIGFISGSGTSQKNLTVKDEFQSNKIKLLIGTDTIVEGMDLQNYTTTLYVVEPDYSPTTSVQVEGRLYRQGNHWGRVRIVYPLMFNSIDVFVYSKLSQKISVVQEMISAGQFDMNETIYNVDLDEQKMYMLTDPKVKAELYITLKKSSIQEKLTSAFAQKTALDNIINDYPLVSPKYNEIVEVCKEVLDWHKKVRILNVTPDGNFLPSPSNDTWDNFELNQDTSPFIVCKLFEKSEPKIVDWVFNYEWKKSAYDVTQFIEDKNVPEDVVVITRKSNPDYDEKRKLIESAKKQNAIIKESNSKLPKEKQKKLIDIPEFTDEEKEKNYVIRGFKKEISSFQEQLDIFTQALNKIESLESESEKKEDDDSIILGYAKTGEDADKIVSKYRQVIKSRKLKKDLEIVNFQLEKVEKIVQIIGFQKNDLDDINARRQITNVFLKMSDDFDTSNENFKIIASYFSMIKSKGENITSAINVVNDLNNFIKTLESEIISLDSSYEELVERFSEEEEMINKSINFSVESKIKDFLSMNDSCIVTQDDINQSMISKHKS